MVCVGDGDCRESHIDGLLCKDVPPHVAVGALGRRRCNLFARGRIYFECEDQIGGVHSAYSVECKGSVALRHLLTVLSLRRASRVLSRQKKDILLTNIPSRGFAGVML